MAWHVVSRRATAVTRRVGSGSERRPIFAGIGEIPTPLRDLIKDVGTPHWRAQWAVLAHVNWYTGV